MNTIKTTNSHTKATILAFVKNLVTKKVYKALQALLSPCCYPILTGVEFTCDPDNAGNYVATLTFDRAIEAGSTFLLFYIDNAVATEGDAGGEPFFIATSTGSTQVVTNIFTNIVSPAGERGVRLNIIQPVSEFNTAILTITDSIVTIFPSC